jgi:FdhE protein
LASTHRLLTPEQIAVQAGESAAFLRLPDPASLFEQRGTRLRQCAAGHPMRDYLMFIAQLAQAQHQVAQDYPAMALPQEMALQQAAARMEPPASVGAHRRDPAWRTGLFAILDALLEMPRTVLPATSAVREAAAHLRQADESFIERQADRILTRTTLGLDLACAPFLAAGLQLYFSTWMSRTAQAFGATRAFGRTRQAGLCPCCESPPVASVVRIGADESGIRYLQCSVCSAQWHMVRIKCAHCESTKGISHQSLQPNAAAGAGMPRTGSERAAIRAECCEACGHYLKIVYMDVDPEVDPCADDLASISLDLLLAEEGLEPAGFNPLIVFGDPGGG